MSSLTKPRVFQLSYERRRRMSFAVVRRRETPRGRWRYVCGRAWKRLLAPHSCVAWRQQMCATLLLLFCGTLAGPATADDAPAPKLNYEEHIKPIFRDHCFLCHNANEAKSDLALDNYSALMRGGASGGVIEPGDPDNSRLWLLVTHQDSPPMPPEKEKLDEATLTRLKEWILAGAPETAGSKVKLKKKPTMDLTASAGAAKPEGLAAMPQGLSRQPAVFTTRPAQAAVMATSPWAPLVALAGEHQIVLYHTDTGQFLGVIPFPEGRPYVLRFSRNGALLMAGGGHASKAGRVVVFDVVTGQRVFEVGDELDAVLAADINEDHTRIALGGPSRMVRVFSLEDGSLLHEIKKHTDWVTALEFSPDGVLLASADRAGNMYLWEAETAREYQTLKGHTAIITSLSWRDDSNVLASSSEDNSVRLWEVENGGQIKSWAAHSGAASVAFAHDGRLVTAGRDHTIQVWDQNGANQRGFEAFGDISLRALFTHDGARVVAGDWYGDVRLLNVADGAVVGRLPINPPTLEMVAQQTAAQAQQAAATAAQVTAELPGLEQALAAKSAQTQAAAAAAQAASAEAKAAAERATQALAAAEQLAKELAATQQQLAELAARIQQLQAAAAQAQGQADQAAAEKAAYDAAQSAQQASAAATPSS